MTALGQISGPLRGCRESWEDLADLDPWWAVLSDKNRRGGKWLAEEFFETGDREVAAFLRRSGRLGYPRGRQSVLDFGCGLGRQARALAGTFADYVGIDISESMIRRARELHSGLGNARFLVHGEPDLRLFADETFDVVYTKIVLQHLPSRPLIEAYLSELYRVLKRDGLFFFQLPCHVPVWKRASLRNALYFLLKGAGFPKRFLFEKFSLYPCIMNYMPERDVTHLCDRLGAKIIARETDSSAGRAADSRSYFVTK